MDFEALEIAMADLDEDTVLALANKAAEFGFEGASKAMDACQKGMEVIGDRFEEGEYFIGDLVFAGEIMNEVFEIFSPIFEAQAKDKIEHKIVICTVKGDLHDIGKNIVRSILKASGFTVIDLGIDCDPQKIIDCINEQHAEIVALSGILTLAIDSMKTTVEAITQAGLRDKVHLLIGGNPASEEACRMITAVAWARSPQRAVEICRDWTK